MFCTSDTRKKRKLQNNEEEEPTVTEMKKSKEEVEDGNVKANDLVVEQKDKNEASQGEEKSKRKRLRKRKKKPKNVISSDNGAVPESEQEKYQSVEYTVFVEGIPFDCSEGEVENFFAENGCNDVIQMRLPRWQDTGRLRGFGHIVFDSKESRLKSLTDLNGKNLRHRYLNIKEPNSQSTQSNKSRAQPEGCKTIFIRNLPYDITEEEIHQTFLSCGRITEGGVRMVRRQNHFKGFAYLEYKNPESAFSAYQRAMKPEGIVIKGRKVIVDYDEGTMKGSYRDNDGRLWHKQYGNHENNGKQSDRRR